MRLRIDLHQRSIAAGILFAGVLFLASDLAFARPRNERKEFTANSDIVSQQSRVNDDVIRFRCDRVGDARIKVRGSIPPILEREVSVTCVPPGPVNCVSGLVCPASVSQGTCQHTPMASVCPSGSTPFSHSTKCTIPLADGTLCEDPCILCIPDPPPPICLTDDDCPDNDPCTEDVCDVEVQECKHFEIPDCPQECTPENCNDQNPCTNDVCDGDSCTHTPKCVDTNNCTEDTCSSSGECSFPAIPNCACNPTPDTCRVCPKLLGLDLLVTGYADANCDGEPTPQELGAATFCTLGYLRQFSGVGPVNLQFDVNNDNRVNNSDIFSIASLSKKLYQHDATAQSAFKTANLMAGGFSKQDILNQINAAIGQPSTAASRQAYDMNLDGKVDAADRALADQEYDKVYEASLGNSCTRALDCPVSACPCACSC